MTSWLQERRSFVPVFDDVEALGARFDSIGWIDDRLILIEYKVGVSEAVVRHRDDRPMSLESKIAGGLRSLYGRASDPGSIAANTVWDRARPPLVVIAAEKFAPSAVSALRALFHDRSDYWAFDWAAWRWAGTTVDELISGEGARKPLPADYERIEVPHLIGRASRGATRTLEELMDLASPEEAQLLQRFVAGARAQGYLFRFGRTKVAALGERGGRRVIVAAAYIGASPLGLNVGIDVAQAVDPQSLDNLPLAKPAGFLNRNVSIHSAEDFDALFQAMGPGRGN